MERMKIEKENQENLIKMAEQQAIVKADKTI